jgi:hypothetical protein
LFGTDVEAFEGEIYSINDSTPSDLKAMREAQVT